MHKEGSPIRVNNFLSKGWVPSVKTTHDRTTSQKKVKSNPLEFKRSIPRRNITGFVLDGRQRFHSIEQQILKLESRKYRCIQQGRYSRAQVIDNKIKRARSQMGKSRVRELIVDQKRQKRSISEAHRKEIGYLNLAWHQYFQNLQLRQNQILQCFRREEQRQIRRSQDKIQKRCRSLNVVSREVIELKQKKQSLQQKQKYGQLRLVRVQLNDAREKRSRLISRYTELEQERLSIAQSKKYSVLISRLDQYRRDKEHTYLREQKRLKQKYKNVLQKLSHQQKMELDQMNTMIKLLQY